jgi:hypothetical protein
MLAFGYARRPDRPRTALANRRKAKRVSAQGDLSRLEASWIDKNVAPEAAAAIRGLLRDPLDLSPLRSMSDRSEVVRPLFEVLGIDHGGEAYGAAWTACRNLAPGEAIRELVGCLMRSDSYERRLREHLDDCGYRGPAIAPRQAKAAAALALDVISNLLWYCDDPYPWFEVLGALARTYAIRGESAWLGDSARALDRAMDSWAHDLWARSEYLSQEGARQKRDGTG